MAKKIITLSDLDGINSNGNPTTNKVEVGQTTNALVGSGRPDKPETTQGKIKGNDSDGTLYQSTNGIEVDYD